MIEFGQYAKKCGHGGVEISPDGSASIPGLYAAGNVIGNVRGSISQAAVFGKISGESAAEYAKTTKEKTVDNHPLIKETADKLQSFLERENGGTWHEANAVLQQIMADYIANEKRSATLLNAGLKYLRDLRETVYSELKCSNSHELMRSLEVLDLLDLCEVAALMAENRKETRGKNHIRPDYPFTNPLWDDHFQTIEKINGEVVMEFRKNKHMEAGKLSG